VKEPDSRGGRTVELAVREMYVTIVTCDDDKFDGSVLYADNDAVAIGPWFPLLAVTELHNVLKAPIGSSGDDGAFEEELADNTAKLTLDV
jgi:hypothetical protein